MDENVEYISTELRKRREELKLTESGAACKLSLATGIGPQTTRTHIECYENGRIYGTSSSIGSENFAYTYLKRLGIYLDVLELSGKRREKLVERIMKADGRFESSQHASPESILNGRSHVIYQP